MAFIPVPSGIQVELRMLLDEQRIENTLWFAVPGAVTPALVTAAANVGRDWWVGNMPSILSTDISLVEVYATDMSSQTGSVASVTTGLPVTGGDGDPAAANQNALCVSFRTAQRGRSGRGRNYVAGIPGNALVSNTWQPPFPAAIVAAYEDIETYATAAGMTWCVCSRYANNAPRAAGVLLPVTSVLVVDAIVDSQRRRTPGRGQ